MNHIIFKITLSALLIGNGICIHAQDTIYARETINTLASEAFYGRGYVNKGDLKAAKFIASELKQLNVIPVGKNYFQNFSFPMNTFPGKMDVTLDSESIAPVAGFVVSPDCPSIKGNYSLVFLPSEMDEDSILFDSLTKIDYSGKFVVAPLKKRKITRNNPFNASGVIVPKKSLIWWASTGSKVSKTPTLLIIDSLLENKSSIQINVQQKFYKNYQSQNIIGQIRGSEFPDSVVAFSAHYDHLGAMGKNNIFRGANDNASGTAMLLSLAQHYSKPENKPKFTIVFMFFSAEERGLLGSKHYVDNPLLPLSNIKMLINLDMVGSGSDGIAIVNGEKNATFTKHIERINEESQYLSNIKVRGTSCNSDHCYFDKAGVPAIFIYTMGNEFKEYHNLNDVPEKLPLTKFSELQLLLTQYLNEL